VVIAWLGFSNNRSEHDRYWARRCISTLWASMHQSMLLEFDREVPVLPLSKYLDHSPSCAYRLKEGSLTEEYMRDEHRRQRDRLLSESKKLEARLW
jgi:hypothetical protein